MSQSRLIRMERRRAALVMLALCSLLALIAEARHDQYYKTLGISKDADEATIKKVKQQYFVRESAMWSLVSL